MELGDWLVIISFILVLVVMFSEPIKRIGILRNLPPDIKKEMNNIQRITFVLGADNIPTVGIQHKADNTLIEFNNAWNNVENVFKQFGTSFEKRKSELELAEKNLSILRHKIEQQNERLSALDSLTPEAAKEVISELRSSSHKSFRQQLVMNTAFFLLGVLVTLAVNIIMG